MKYLTFVFFFSMAVAHAETISKDGFIWINANTAMKTCDQIFGTRIQKPGEVVLDIKLDGAGSVLNATPDLKKSSIKDEKLISCISNSFKGHTIAADGTGKERIVSATFRFPRNSEQ